MVTNAEVNIFSINRFFYKGAEIAVMDVIFTSSSRIIRLEVENKIKMVIHLLESTSRSSILDESAVDYILYKLDKYIIL